MSAQGRVFRKRDLTPFDILTIYDETTNFDKDEPLDSDDPQNSSAPTPVAEEPTVATPPPSSIKKKKKMEKKSTATKNSSQKNKIPSPKAGTLTEQLNIESGATQEKKIALPVPESADATSQFSKIVKSDFKTENAYIRHRFFEMEDRRANFEVEYMMDHDDMLFLSGHAKYGPKGSSPLKEENFERIIDILEKKTARDLELVHESVGVRAVLQSFQSTNEKLDVATANDIYAYWYKKRSSRYLCKPLLRRFWPVTPVEDTDPHRTFRPRDKDKYVLRRKRVEDMVSYEKLVQLKNEFQMMKCLLDLVRRREALHDIESRLLFDELDCAVHTLVHGDNKSFKGQSPVNVGVGPLLDSEWKPIFEIFKPEPRHVAQTASDFGGTKDPNREKKKIKKTKRATSSFGGTETVSATTEVKKKKVEEPVPELPKLPVNPPRFLASMENMIQYANRDLEISLPVIPSWPLSVGRPSNPTGTHEKVRQPQSYPLMLEQKDMYTKYPGELKTEDIKYRCRGRIGRGGRRIIDRIPILHGAHVPRKTILYHEYAGPSIFTNPDHVFLDPIKPRQEYQELSQMESKQLNLSAAQRSRIQSIYTQDDSEDEEVEIYDYGILAPLRMDADDQASFDTAPTESNRLKKIKEVKVRFIL